MSRTGNPAVSRIRLGKDKLKLHCDSMHAPLVLQLEAHHRPCPAER